MKTMTTYLSLHLSFRVAVAMARAAMACFDRLLFSCFSCSGPVISPCSFLLFWAAFPGWGVS
jgi:hypothetical protein